MPICFYELIDILSDMEDFTFIISHNTDFDIFMHNRLIDAEKFYLIENGQWSENFYSNLGDEISKISFLHYLKIRFIGHIHNKFKIIYPVDPPKETKEWRELRIKNINQFPKIEGCSKSTLDWFRWSTYIVEQYAIDNHYCPAKENFNRLFS